MKEEGKDFGEKKVGSWATKTLENSLAAFGKGEEDVGAGARTVYLVAEEEGKEGPRHAGRGKNYYNIIF